MHVKPQLMAQIFNQMKCLLLRRNDSFRAPESQRRAGGYDWDLTSIAGRHPLLCWSVLGPPLVGDMWFQVY